MLYMDNGSSFHRKFIPMLLLSLCTICIAFSELGEVKDALTRNESSSPVQNLRDSIESEGLHDREDDLISQKHGSFPLTFGIHRPCGQAHMYVGSAAISPNLPPPKFGLIF
jgi:hypothetical protein